VASATIGSTSGARPRPIRDKTRAGRERHDNPPRETRARRLMKTPSDADEPTSSAAGGHTCTSASGW
jgi:hypothetical protein